MSQPTSRRSLPLLADLLSRMRAHPYPLALTTGLLVVHQAAEVAVPVLVGVAVAAISGESVFSLTAVAAALLTVGVIRAGARFGQGVAQARLAQRVVRDLRLDLHASALALDAHDLRLWRKGELIARATRDVDHMRAFFGDLLFAALELALLVIGALVVLALTAPRLAWIAAPMFVGCAGLMVLAAPLLRRQVRAYDDAYDRVADAISETVAGARVVRAFTQEDAQQQAFDGHVEGFLDRLIKAWDTFAVTMPLSSICFSLSIPLALVIGGAAVMQGAMSVAELTAGLLYMTAIGQRLQVVGRVVMAGQSAAASAERWAEVARRELPAEPAQPASLPATGGRLELAGVTVTAPSGDVLLRELDLVVPAGQTLGLVGPTGGGKTTLLALVGRLLEPSAGQLTLDGVPLERLPRDVLRRELGYVFQDTFLFSQTIADNIRYGRPDADEASVAEAARLAQAAEFIEALPERYRTLVGQRGVTLSGGQRQRLAVARALCARPRLLLLDDPVASLDAATASRLEAALQTASARCTTLIATHRLASARNADQIAVLEGGRLTELGSHEALLRRGGWYARTWRLQHEDLGTTPRADRPGAGSGRLPASAFA